VNKLRSSRYITWFCKLNMHMSMLLIISCRSKKIEKIEIRKIKQFKKNRWCIFLSVIYILTIFRRTMATKKVSDMKERLKLSIKSCYKFDSWNILAESNKLSAILDYWRYTYYTTRGVTQSWQAVINMNPKLVFGCFFKFPIE
jgi:hypothetical protein